MDKHSPILLYTGVIALLLGLVAVMCYATADDRRANRDASDALEKAQKVLPEMKIGGLGVGHTVITLPTGERFFIVGHYNGISCAQILPVVKP